MLRCFAFSYCSDSVYCTGTYCFKGPDSTCKLLFIPLSPYSPQNRNFFKKEFVPSKTPFTATGIVYGCVNMPPIDNKIGSRQSFIPNCSLFTACKLYSGIQIKKNCYCKNQDFCNHSSILGLFGLVIISIFLFFF